MLVKLDSHLSMAFCTPILVRRGLLAAEVNTALERAIRMRAECEGGVQVSNVGGWQSPPDLFDWPDAGIAQLGCELDRLVRQLVFAAGGRAEGSELKIWKAGWANVNRNGDYNILHNHPDQEFAAVYYLKIPNGPRAGGGQLELRDPRPAAGFCSFPELFNAEPLRITPEPGMLVLFPAWLDHMVHPHNGAEERISIAVNIKLLGFAG